MLAWLLQQVGTGLVSDDEIANAGPLTALVSGSTVSLATAWHKGPGKLLLIVLVLTHVAAIAWYSLRRSQSLVPAMVHGDKTLPTAPPGDRSGNQSGDVTSRDTAVQRVLALVLLLVCALAVRWLIGLGG